VQYGSSPENVDKLNAAVMTELDRLRKEGPSAADLQIVKEADKNDLAQALRQNAYWLNALQSSHILGRDPKMIPRRRILTTRTLRSTNQSTRRPAYKGVTNIARAPMFFLSIQAVKPPQARWTCLDHSSNPMFSCGGNRAAGVAPREGNQRRHFSCMAASKRCHG
jgi:hypothetical protein